MNRFFTKKSRWLVPLFLLTLGSCEKSEKREYPLLPTEKDPEMDITSYGVLSVNRENSGGNTAKEGSLKVVDNDYSTKFLINPYQNDLYIQLAFPGGIAVTSYIVASADDAPARDPKDWELVGSNDMQAWTVIDKKEGYVFSARNQKVRFDTSNKEKYRYYRFNVKAISGGTGLFQMAELRLINDPQVQ
ncbi:discoidin/SUN/FTP domain-containing protein [Sphingobacterium psychroaquaticum]|uniref:ATP/GTP-binding protein n=1 Tax=Sphingobacterium psychroaquaticum TaxID=561061 RepID=UPI001F0D204F|nr:ATP/GTP-binding protein [Sphingobacterium psychroaquaticum]